MSLRLDYAELELVLQALGTLRNCFMELKADVGSIDALCKKVIDDKIGRDKTRAHYEQQMLRFYGEKSKEVPPAPANS